MKSTYRFHYDGSTQIWTISRINGDNVLGSSRVVLDAQAETRGNSIVCEGVLKTDGYPVRPERKGRSIRAARFIREVPLPGKVNERSMLEWCVVFSEGSGKWLVYLHGSPSISVLTKRIEFNCHAISSGRILHCQAEMLINGKTNRGRSPDVDTLRLRTLMVHDQEVQIKKINVAGVAKNL